MMSEFLEEHSQPGGDEGHATIRSDVNYPLIPSIGQSVSIAGATEDGHANNHEASDDHGTTSERYAKEGERMDEMILVRRFEHSLHLFFDVLSWIKALSAKS